MTTLSYATSQSVSQSVCQSICLLPFSHHHYSREASGFLGSSVPGPSRSRESSHTEEGACNMLLGNKDVVCKLQPTSDTSQDWKPSESSKAWNKRHAEGGGAGGGEPRGGGCEPHRCAEAKRMQMEGDGSPAQTLAGC